MTINLSYNQILGLIEQLPAKSRLRLGRTLTKNATKDELRRLLDSFQTDEISEEDILNEVKQVRKERYERKKEEEDLKV